jgi:hypothetical protein
MRRILEEARVLELVSPRGILTLHPADVASADMAEGILTLRNQMKLNIVQSAQRPFNDSDATFAAISGWDGKTYYAIQYQDIAKLSDLKPVGQASLQPKAAKRKAKTSSDGKSKWSRRKQEILERANQRLAEQKAKRQSKKRPRKPKKPKGNRRFQEVVVICDDGAKQSLQNAAVASPSGATSTGRILLNSLHPQWTNDGYSVSPRNEFLGWIAVKENGFWRAMSLSSIRKMEKQDKQILLTTTDGKQHTYEDIRYGGIHAKDRAWKKSIEESKIVSFEIRKR